MFFKHSLFFLFFILATTTVTPVVTKPNICKKLKPCGKRGVCVDLEYVKSKDVFSTKCICRLNYTGQWCQFVDEGLYKPSEKGTPDIPTIVTDTTVPNYNLHYKLTFNGVKDPAGGKVLYYIARYNDFSNEENDEWRSVIVAAKKGQDMYNVLFNTLDWGREYTIEIYAGNKHGLGQPVKQKLRRPRVSLPRIMETTEDLTGSKAICCNKSLELFCKAQGFPAPTYSWLFNGNPLQSPYSVSKKHGYLKIKKPSPENHEGEYRCLASNAWGSIMSRPIEVDFAAPRTFIHDNNIWDGPVLIHKVNLGEPLNLPCPKRVPNHSEDIKWSGTTNIKEVEDFPISDRVWVSSTGSLYFAYVTQEDLNFINGHGGIRCNLGWTMERDRPFEGSNLFKLVKKGVRKLKIPLAFYEKPKDVTVISGSPAQLYCSSKSSSKTVLRWIKGNHRQYLENNNKYQISDHGRMLHIKNTNESDAGTYTCVVYVGSQEGNKSYEGNGLPTSYPVGDVLTATARLSVSGPSSLRYRLIPEISVYQGTTLALTCGNGKIADNVKWFYNGKPLEKRINKTEGIINGKEIFYSNNNGRLEMVNVQGQVSGVYQCDVDTNLGLVTVAEYVHVRGFTQSDLFNANHKRSNEIILKEGSSATITCLPRPFHAFPITWNNLPKIKSSRFREMENGFLEIHGIRKSDNMNISCGIPSDYSVSITRNIHTSVITSVNGGWSEWSIWSSCRGSIPGCKTYAYMRTRSCNNPAPEHDGKYCSGSDTDIDSGCMHAIGLQNGEIADNQLISSHKSIGQIVPSNSGMVKGAHPEYARLHGKAGWCGQVGLPVEEKNYLQISLGSIMRLTGIATHGVQGYILYKVRSYSLRFSMDGLSWFNYSNPNTVWSGPVMTSLYPKRYSFNRPIYASFVRIYVENYFLAPCLRAELYGCEVRNSDYIQQKREYVKESQTKKGKVKVLKGIWDRWRFWSECLLPADDICGTKLKARHRKCMPRRSLYRRKGNYRWVCGNSYQQIRSCGKVKCPEWSLWSVWKPCESSAPYCKPNIEIRKRTCSISNPRFVKKYCPGPQKQRRICNDIACHEPVDGGWSSWSNWTTCSASCNTGVKSRTRTCTNPVPQHGGLNCTGEDTNSAECDTFVVCKVNGSWSAWSKWSECSTTCNLGQKLRTRSCTEPRPQGGGMECQGAAKDAKECIVNICKVNGGWTSWTNWSACSVSCNHGVRIRTRTCTNPIPRHRGKDCEGENEDMTQCNLMPCPAIDGGWSIWSQWSSCSSSCFPAVKSRVRACTNPEPQHGGKPCVGVNAATTNCETKPCKVPVHGGWSSWSKWSTCTASCNSGVKIRKRTCTNPAPINGGRKCHGGKFIKTRCNIMLCKGKEEGQDFPSDTFFDNNAPLVGASGAGAMFFLMIIICCSCRTCQKKSKAKKLKKCPESKGADTEKEPLLKVEDSGASFVWPTPPDEPTRGGPEVSSVKSGALPPPPPPTSSQDARTRPASRGKRHASSKSRPSKTSTKTSESIYGGMLGFDKATMESSSGKIKDAQINKIPALKKESNTPNDPRGPTTSSAAPKLASESVYGNMVSFNKAVVDRESGKIKDAQIHKIPKLKKESSGSTVLKGPSPSPPAPPPPPPPAQPANRATLSQVTETPTSAKVVRPVESAYGTLIGFENAILETGNEDAYVKKAKIQKIASKKKPPKTKDES